MHWASESGLFQVTQLLASYSPLSTRVCDERGALPSDVAEGAGHEALAVALKTLGDMTHVSVIEVGVEDDDDDGGGANQNGEKMRQW